MQHLDDGTIHAWLDGALGADQAGRVAEHVAVCRACADRVAEARGFIAASSRILMALDDVPANVVPAEIRVAAAAPVASPAVAATPASTGAVALRARWWGHRYGRLAAVLAFVVAGTFVLTREANRRDIAALGQKERPTDEPLARRDSALPQTRQPTVASPAAAGDAGAAPRREAAAAPPAALGGARPRVAPKPSLEPQVKSFAQEERQQAAMAKKSPSDMNLAIAAAANKTADSASRAAQAPNTLARRIGEGKALQLSEVIVTGQAVGGQWSPRLVSVDSVERGPVMVRRRTYAIDDSTRVVLEATLPSPTPNDMTAAVPAAALADSAAARDTGGAAVHVIRWRGSDGTRYALSGPVGEDVLQRVRAALGKNP